MEPDNEAKGSAIEVYDRLHGVKDVTLKDWDFCCPYCKSERLNIHALDISIRPHTINDFSDLPSPLKEYYSKLPTIVDAIIYAANNERGVGVCIECLDCKMIVEGFINKRGSNIERADPNIQRLKKYLVRFYGYEEVLNI